MINVTPQQSVEHYENFPVGSILLPRRYRKAVAAVYHFARHADDLADEGNASPDERLAALAACSAELRRVDAGQQPETARYQALATVIYQYGVPVTLCEDLLSAFRQDVTQSRYADFGELVQYCRRSANPVGRILLHIFGEVNPRYLAMSDGICTALQLVNFWQDAAIDWTKDRVYLPQDELVRFGVSESQIAAGEVNPAWQRLMRFQVDRTRRMLKAGAPLASALPGRVGFELRLTVLGAAAILDKLDACGYDVFHRRPTLGKGDWPRLLWRAWRRK
ncbi:squalene synthase HpnC [Jeongeupia sp. HS-3]|uniref:squalene synthase HpnC n=1 Tax=Jeongeupia sp. HS-3 TaxID=1009682 RepID=UPI0018A508CD|nr:squalene synthase HpnC [Jeongeupia sp. HS-3]BCL74515.1 squalene synthase HpnC [Jeongeupia sp. HS-3]